MYKKSQFIRDYLEIQFQFYNFQLGQLNNK
jgi:hypothetical protein